MINLSTNDWTIENIDTILFDKDGTFIDLHYFWGKMTELRAKKIISTFNLNKNLEEKLCLYLGYDLKKSKMLADGITALYSRQKIIEIFKENLKSIGVTTTTLELEKIFDETSNEFYNDIQKHTKPIDEAILFIKEIKKHNIKIGIVTSDSVQSTNLTLQQFKWEDLFDIVIGRESSPHTKESGEPTKLALSKLNANPNKTLMIGDAPMDYISAKNANIPNCILVATGQIKTNELKKISNYTVNSLSDIKIIVNCHQF